MNGYRKLETRHLGLTTLTNNMIGILLSVSIGWLIFYFVILLVIFCIFQRQRLTTTPPRYKACDVDLKQSDLKPNYWLLSDQITVSEADRIDVTVKYLITSCSTIPDSGGHYCVNAFDLYVNQSNQFIADPALYPDPLSNSVTYKKKSQKLIRLLIK